MFEKEAEEYANKNVPIDTFGFRSLDDVHYDVKQAYQQGAEFGYNKANEWISFQKELPPLNEYVLVWNNEDIFPISGKRMELPDKDWMMDFPNCRIYRSIAMDYFWKEIVPPEHPNEQM